MPTTRLPRFVALVGALSVLITACSGGGRGASNDTSPPLTTSPTTTTTAEPKPGGSVAMGMVSEPAGLDPVLMTGGGAAGATEGGAIFDVIMRYDVNTKK